MVNFKEVKFSGFEALRIENKFISLVTIPNLGGKIVSLVNKKTGFDFLWANKNIELQISPYDSDFSKSDCSGIDECFPTISPCIYPDFPWKGIKISDHGEIWPLRFSSIIKRNTLIQKVYGIRFPYCFIRNINLEKNIVVLSYRLNNFCQFDFKYLWSIHPILKLQDNTEIIVEGTPNFSIDYYTKSSELSKMKKHSWPFIKNKNNDVQDISKINKNKKFALKGFLSNLRKGIITLNYNIPGEKITFQFKTSLIKYCGIWINSYGWPNEKIKYNHIAIEPCNGISDSLEECNRKNSIGIIKAGDENTWSIRLKIG